MFTVSDGRLSSLVLLERLDSGWSETSLMCTCTCLWYDGGRRAGQDGAAGLWETPCKYGSVLWRQHFIGLTCCTGVWSGLETQMWPFRASGYVIFKYQKLYNTEQSMKKPFLLTNDTFVGNVDLKFAGMAPKVYICVSLIPQFVNRVIYSPSPEITTLLLNLFMIFTYLAI